VSATFEDSVLICASAESLFRLTQDYTRRLEWDPFLKVATLVGGAVEPGVGVRAWCVAKSGFGMETEYVSFDPPRRTAVRMTKGPLFLRKFSGSWVFREEPNGQTRVTFRYHVVARPKWLGKFLGGRFEKDTTRRLLALKRFCELDGA
jgi:ribosome-associated toxin RatA of RatAB toxin-antitoxin module